MSIPVILKDGVKLFYKIKITARITFPAAETEDRSSD